MDEYRKCAVIFVRNPQNGLYFAAERSDCPGEWQVPQGGVEEGESHLEGATRELLEETRIRTVRLLRNTKNLYKYEFPGEISQKLKQKNHRHCFLGQEARFFLFEFLGDESEIDLSYSGEAEFSNWKWMKLKEIRNHIVYFKKSAFEAAISELFPEEI